MESIYLDRFKKLQESGHAGILGGTYLLVEELPKQELTTKGGLIISTSLSNYKNDTEENRGSVCIILQVGIGLEDDPSYKPGNVVLLSKEGKKYYSQFPGLLEYTENKIALTNDDQVHMVWENIEHFQKYTEVLNNI